MKFLIALSTFVSLSAFARADLPTASYVDVKQYVGKWYAITSLPQFFTRKCVAQTADYALKTANSISVLNTCIKENGSTKTISGQAVIINPQTNAELEVTFDNFWTKLFRVKGDYTIIKLDESYSTVLVGSRDRKSLWILSRTPYLNEEVKKEYIAFARSVGFDTTKLEDSKF
ncbi:MAG: lipocalin family protein [Bacteriovorax sp.]|nr:lipocalin family protein [Bacteriovorax sp.]